MMKNRHATAPSHSNGFTLIELVAVIVILSILSVTALSRFLDLQSDSRVSALNALKGGMESASSMLYAKSVSVGQENVEDETININGDQIKTAYGYPVAENAQSWALLLDTTTLDAVWGVGSADWYFTNTADDGSIIYTQESRKQASSQCFLQYTQATSSALPSFEITTSGC